MNDIDLSELDGEQLEELANIALRSGDDSMMPDPDYRVKVYRDEYTVKWRRTDGRYETSTSRGSKSEAVRELEAAGDGALIEINQFGEDTVYTTAAKFDAHDFD